MTTFVADHSTAGAIIGGSLKKAGFTGVVRYAAAGRGNVNITPAEVKDLHANGLSVGVVLEHEANWLLNTPSVAARVAGSRDICRACGLPDGVIYLAADFDITNGGPTAPGSPGDKNMRTALASLAAAGRVIGFQNVGFYGSKFAVDWLLKNATWVKYFWQTEAWSHGELSPAAQLFQRAQSTNVAGVSVDIDVQLKPDWGQRHPQAQPAKPPAPPAPKFTHDQVTFNQGFQSGFEAGWKARG